MKIDIDEVTMANAIKNDNIGLAEWLLDNHCPVNCMSYSVATKVETLDWLLSKGVKIEKKALLDAIPKADIKILKWFCNKCVIDSQVVASCIKHFKFEFIDYILQVKSINLDIHCSIAAADTDSSAALDFLKSKGGLFDESVLDYAIKFGKKNTIKWLAKNSYIQE